jgi:hypothetical protein
MPKSDQDSAGQTVVQPAKSFGLSKDEKVVGGTRMPV